MKYESGAESIQYDFFSVNGQMARELKRSIKEKKRLELALELLAAVNRDAYDRGKRNEIEPTGVVSNNDSFPGFIGNLPVGDKKVIVTRRGRFIRTVIWCDNHKRKEARLRRII